MLSRTFIDKLRNMILPMQFAAQLQIMNDIKTKMGDSDGVIFKVLLYIKTEISYIAQSNFIIFVCIFSS